MNSWTDLFTSFAQLLPLKYHFKFFGQTVLYCSNGELLERVNVEKLSEEIRRRWRFIRHILRQPDNDCVTALTWTPEGKRKRGWPKTTWRRTVEKERSKTGLQSWGERCALQRKTGIDGQHMWRPYAKLAHGSRKFSVPWLFLLTCSL